MDQSDPNAGRKLRIAVVSYSWGEICARLTAALADQGNEVLLITSAQQYERFRYLGDPRVDVIAPEMPRLRNPLRNLQRQWQALREIRRFGPDVIHLQHGHLWFNLTLLLLGRYPLVLTVHDPRHHLGDRSSQTVPQPVLDAGFRRADRIIVHAEPMIKPMVEEIGIARERIRVVPLIQLGDEHLSPDATEIEGTVLWFGRIWAYKGLDQFIRCQPEVSRRVPSARFVIAGEGEDMSHYYELMADPAAFTVHNQYVSEEMRARLFRESSVIALPYLEATQSGVVMNAASYAKPVIATSVGGLVEQIEDGVTGRLIAPNDTAALTDAIVALLQDRTLRESLGRAAHEKLCREHDGHSIATATMRVYTDLLTTGDPR